MAWWNDFVAWINSTSGARVFLSAILPFLAIIVAGVLAALIGRSAAKRVVDYQDRELKGAAIMALIVVGRKASIWSSLGSDERQHVDSLMSEADIRVRLLPVSGASTAADWAAHQLTDMKKNSASFSFQAEQTFVDYRDRLLDWQNKPGRAKKLFASDLSQWRYEDETPASAPTQEWTPAPLERSSPTVTPTPTPTAPAPAPAPAPASAAPAPSTAPVTAITPGLASAPPPTASASDAPPPPAVSASAAAAAKRPSEDDDDY